jgi:pimeloyl-ACP methyl ester carboxylesterase
MNEVTRPRLEGTIAVRGDRRLGFAEFGSPHGPAIIWMHGTPGARRQIPVEARAYADREGLRIIGIDRPGIGSSTPHVYESIIDWSADLEMVADTLGIDTMRLIGLSGGGPYVLGAAAALSDRVLGVAVLGGVPPTRGPDAPAGGLVSLAARLEPLVSVGRVPLGLALTIGILVDDSIVILENIHRHMKLGDSPWEAALNGRREIGAAALAITLVDVVGYLPIVFLTGITA